MDEPAQAVAILAISRAVRFAGAIGLKVIGIVADEGRPFILRGPDTWPENPTWREIDRVIENLIAAIEKGGAETETPAVHG